MSERDPNRGRHRNVIEVIFDGSRAAAARLTRGAPARLIGDDGVVLEYSARNALEHAIANAFARYYSGTPLGTWIRSYGDTMEGTIGWAFGRSLLYGTSLRYQELDAQRDLLNNMIGERVGEWMRENNRPTSDLIDILA